MGTAIALKEETAPVPGTPNTLQELVPELRVIADHLDVGNRLRAYGAALRVLQQPDTENAGYFLLRIDPAANEVTVKGFSRSEIMEAASEYLEAEKAIGDSQADAVLVSVESVAALRRAYPNYFADTHVFVSLLQEALGDVEPNLPFELP